MNHRFQDDDVITIPAPAGGVSAGQFVRIGMLSGFALDAASEGDPVGLARRGRVLDALKAAVAIDAGDPLFHDDTAHVFTNVPQGDAPAGAVAVTDAAQEAATVDLVLVPATGAFDSGDGYEPDGTTVDLVADHLHVKAGGHTHAQSEVTNLPGDLSGMQSAIAGKENAGAAAAAVGSHESTYAHGNLPSSDEKGALAGTNGTPSSTNKYVTDSDPRLSGGGGGGEPASVAVAVAMGETTGSSAADPTHVGWAAISWMPAGADVGLANVVVNPDGSVTVTTLAATTAGSSFTVLVANFGS